MAEGEPDREKLLREEFLRQTGRIDWRDLQRHYARGSVVNVAPALDLVEVAVQLAMDNTAAFQAWIDSGDIAPVSDHRAAAWAERDEMIWAVVAPPWVLVQSRD